MLLRKLDLFCNWTIFFLPYSKCLTSSQISSYRYVPPQIIISSRMCVPRTLPLSLTSMQCGSKSEIFSNTADWLWLIQLCPRIQDLSSLCSVMNWDQTVSDSISEGSRSMLNHTCGLASYVSIGLLLSRSKTFRRALVSRSHFLSECAHSHKGVSCHA